MTEHDQSYTTEDATDEVNPSFFHHTDGCYFSGKGGPTLIFCDPQGVYRSWKFMVFSGPGKSC